MTAPLPLFGALPSWAMERNLVLQAGAGTGKTHALVTLALHLLGGANARQKAVHPSRLVALTFTEKAGAELRERIQQRLAPLADGASLAEREPELARTFGLLGMRLPPADVWAKVRRDLGLASIGTFHGWAAAQLRRLAPLAGLDPAFRVLDEDDAQSLFFEASESCVLEALVAGEAPLRALVDEYGLTEDRPKGLVTLAREVLVGLAEEGRDPVELDDGRFDAARAAGEFVRALRQLHHATEGLGASAGKHQDKHRLAREAMRTLLAKTLPETALPLLPELDGIRRSMEKRGAAAKAELEPLDEAIAAYSTATAALAAAPLGTAFLDLLARIDTRYREAKRVREALDFSDLQRLVRDLLVKDVEVRRATKARVEALLVDEFQDTSRLQLDLVALVAEQRGVEAEVGPRGALASVSLEPGLLCVVGDRKQSIYEFRGADVAVFGALVEAATGQASLGKPATIEALRTSYRSRPGLVEFTNALFSRVMATASRPFEVAFSEDDALVPKLEETGAGPLVELIAAEGDGAEAQRRDEAERIAARIDAMLRLPEHAVPVRDRNVPGGWRPAEGRDIALLFRRLTNLDLYRAALARRGLPHVVVGGGGFYEALEVSDAWALLRAVDDPDDTRAAAALLRSPWCALQDATLARLAIDEGSGKVRGLSLRRLLGGGGDERGRRRGLIPAGDPGGPSDVSRPLPLLISPDEAGRNEKGRDLDAVTSTEPFSFPQLHRGNEKGGPAPVDVEPPTTAGRDEAARLDTLLAFLRDARGLVDRLGAAGVLRLALERLDYLAVVDALPERDQTAANLQRLLRVLEDLETRHTTARGAIRELGERIRSGRRAAGAAASEESDPRSLRLMTVHQSKGLEFPIVFIGDCGAMDPNDADRIGYDRDLGLALSVRRSDEKILAAPGLADVRTRRKERTTAESLRLLYVAATRAKDLLVFSGFPRKDSWMETVAATGPAHVRSATVALDLAPLLVEPPPDAPVVDTPAPARAPLAMAELTATVTRLQDFAACPERHRLRHEVGLEEHAGAAPDTGDDTLATLDVFERGTLAHRMLEVVDFAPLAPRALRRRLDEIALAEGHDPASEEVTSIRDDVEAFLASPFARGLSALATNRRLRELPFLVRLGLGDERTVRLKGQVDLVTIGPEAVRVVDYKHARADKHRDGEYDFQLLTYALAVRGLVGDAGLPLEAGVVFLKDRRAPTFRVLDDATLAAHEQAVTDIAARLVEAHATGTWPKRERPFCDELGCGYRARCWR